MEALDVQSTGTYVDATFGRGGHADAIFQQLDDQGRLIMIDKDPEAIAVAREKYGKDSRVTIFHGSFAGMTDFLQQQGSFGKIQGVLLDLGVSSPQLDDPLRGFSFRSDGPLDMRMNTQAGQSAAEWLLDAPEAEIASVLRDFGEERFARRIARAIVEERQRKAFTRTGHLAEVVAKANPKWEKGKDPATRTFQAIRIFINGELDDLQQSLSQVVDVLAPGGRMAVISFHSLEDRMVKRFIRKQARGLEVPRGVPVTEAQRCPRLKLVSKAIRAGDKELAINPRARSAVLRAAEKIQ